MKVLGIYTYETFFSDKISNYPLQTYQDIPLGFTAILTLIQKESNYVETLVCSQYTDINKALTEEFISQFDLICFTSVAAQLNYIIEIATLIKKKNKDIKIIIGGTGVSLFPEYIERTNLFDAILIGEGIKSIKLYLKYLKKEITASKVLGVWIKENNKIIKNKFIKFSSFKNFPIINRKLWDKWICDNSSHTILISRGCVNSCSYCSNHVLRTKNIGKYVAFRKIENILKEIKEIKKNYKNVRIIHLESESFTINLDFSFQLFQKLKELNNTFDKKISFSINLHLTKKLEQNLNTFIILIKNANINVVYTSLESGSIKLRKNILRRPYYTNSEFIQFCKNLLKYNILLIIGVMLGIPKETEKDLQKTVDIVNKIEPSRTSIAIFSPYPGTDLYNLAKKMGAIKDDFLVNGYNERKIATVNYPNLPAKTIQKYYNILIKEQAERRKAFIKKYILKKGKNNNANYFTSSHK